MKLLTDCDRLVELAEEVRKLSEATHSTAVLKSRSAKMRELAKSLNDAKAQMDCVREAKINVAANFGRAFYLVQASEGLSAAVDSDGQHVLSDSTKGKLFEPFETHGNELVKNIQNATRTAWSAYVVKEVSDLGLQHHNEIRFDPLLGPVYQEAKLHVAWLEQQAGKVPRSATDRHEFNQRLSAAKELIQKLHQNAYPAEVADFLAKLRAGNAHLEDVSEDGLRILKELGLAKVLRVSR